MNRVLFICACVDEDTRKHAESLGMVHIFCTCSNVLSFICACFQVCHVVQQLQLMPLQAEDPTQPAVDTIASRRASLPPSAEVQPAQPAKVVAPVHNMHSYPDVRSFLSACGLAEEVIAFPSQLFFFLSSSYLHLLFLGSCCCFCCICGA